MQIVLHNKNSQFLKSNKINELGILINISKRFIKVHIRDSTKIIFHLKMLS